MNLNLGCGSALAKGFLNVDLVEPACGTEGYDFKLADARNLGWVRANSVDVVKAKYLLEHFTLPEALGVLFQINQILSGGGTLLITVPDFEVIAHEVFKTPANLTVIQYAGYFILNSFEGGITCASSNSPHRSIWTKGSLKNALEWEGFEIRSLSNIGIRNWSIDCIAKKSKDSIEGE